MQIVIFGAGGFAREVMTFLRDAGSHSVTKFVAHDAGVSILLGLPVEEESIFWESLANARPDGAVIAIGKVSVRRKVAAKLLEHGVKLLSFVHPTAYVPHGTKIGQGSIIYPQVCLTSGIEVGECVLLNSSVSVGHDTIIGSFSSLNPGARIAGNVKIGEGAFIGIGASIIENLTIGANAIVGAGAVVIDDVPASATTIGVPARVIKR